MSTTISMLKKGITCKNMVLKVILIRKNGVHFCMVYYVHLVLMMHGYFKILVIVYCLCHLLTAIKRSVYTKLEWKTGRTK